MRVWLKALRLHVQTDQRGTEGGCLRGSDEDAGIWANIRNTFSASESPG